MESRLNTVISLTESILKRLDSKERLSNILSQARLLADLAGDKTRAAWIDCEIHGIDRVPFSEKPRKQPEERAGVLLCLELHKLTDVSSLDYEDILAQPFHYDEPRGDKVIPASIGQLEEIVEAQHMLEQTQFESVRHDREMALLKFRSDILAQEAGRVLRSVRSYLYKYVTGVWLDTVREKENQALLGQIIG